MVRRGLVQHHAPSAKRSSTGKFIPASKPTLNRVSCANEGVQWIRMEELGKALTNRCRGLRELSYKRQKNLIGTRDRGIHSEQLEFECQLRTPTRSRIYELLELGASSSLNLFNLSSPNKTWYDYGKTCGRTIKP